jgi:hypothetical protein
MALLTIGNWDASHGRILDAQARASLADKITQLSGTTKVSQAVLRVHLEKAVGRVSTEYVRGLAKALASVASAQRPDLEQILQAFRLEARRSAGPIFRLDDFRHEEVGRTLILFFLKQRSYPEARIGAGRVDLVLVKPHAVIEVKIEASRPEVASGVRQLADYLCSESGLDDPAIGYLVLFVRDTKPSWWKQFGSSAVVDGRSIRIIWVEIPTKAPSKLKASGVVSKSRKRP